MNNFITNNKEKTLKQRLKSLISVSKELNFLVGFFYFSGIRELFEALKENNDLELKILVGLDVDKTAYGLNECALNGDLIPRERVKKYLDSVKLSLTSESLDKKEFYEQSEWFIQKIIEGKIQIRKTREPNHAKLYLFSLSGEASVAKPRIFLTGSSNLTHLGLSGQNEFNVEISDYGTEEAQEYFQNLWDDAISITESEEFKKELIDIIKNKTMLARITPFEAYVAVIKNYLEAKENKELKQSVYKLIEEAGFKPYKYQLDAVSQALSVIEKNDGVLIADVVGLGKSVIASLVGKILGKRGIIICPPGLIGDENENTGWRMYRNKFRLWDWEIRSNGQETLKKVLEYVKENPDIETIIIDETHRFRNSDTEGYEILKNICRNKKVILLTATPFNNSPADILSMLELFIIPGRSQITLDSNLKGKFRSYNYLFMQLSKIKKYYKKPGKYDEALGAYKKIFDEEKIDIKKVEQKSRALSREIRSVIEPVLIRRNRIDLKNDPEYSKEVYDLSNIEDPRECFYELTEAQNNFYDEVLEKYFTDDESRIFKGAIYQPFKYQKGKVIENEEDLGLEENKTLLSQGNLYDFMRRLLVNRFESSFGAFKASVERFKKVHEKIEAFIKNSGGKFIMDRALLEKIYDDDPEEIERALEEFANKLGEEVKPKNSEVYDINKFSQKDLFLRHIASDKEMFADILCRVEELDLVEFDPKFEALKTAIKKVLNQKKEINEPPRKVIIFTEYVDTAKYLEEKLEAEFPGRVLSMASSFSKERVEEMLANFDASHKNPKDDYQILLGTDKISEGLNLARAGVIFNHDIPWNPTRVIQRLGRINRIGQKVFNNLYIYNFFPSVKGATHIKSREIVQQKMFLIHNALGEDAKIFSADEEPTASGLYTKLTQNPEKQEDESFITKIRKEYYKIKEDYPEVIKKVSELPSRIKVAKKFSKNQVLVFIKKSALFIRGIEDKKVQDYTLEDVLEDIRCQKEEPVKKLSEKFWENYENILKESQEADYKIPSTEQSVERKALNVLKNSYPEELKDYHDFLYTLKEDILEYQTLPLPTLRKITKIRFEKEHLAKTKEILDGLINDLGPDYLEKIKSKSNYQKEVIVAIENQKV